MKLIDIYKPINQNISKLEKELKLISNVDNPSVSKILEYFLNISGKYLRPALVFLSAGAVNNKKLKMKDNDNLIQLALALELLHSASLVHDDIIDKDLLRRGQKTLNNIYGNKIAVLVGDMLHSRSYSIVSNLFSKEYAKAIADLGFKMCVAEIEQVKCNITQQEYFDIIEGKTAFFMSVCCKLGATLMGATQSQIKSMENFGLNFGLAYQIKDDYLDNDENALNNNITLQHAQEFANKAKQSINELEDTVYKKQLHDLMDYVMDMENCKGKKLLKKVVI